MALSSCVCLSTYGTPGKQPATLDQLRLGGIDGCMPDEPFVGVADRSSQRVELLAFVELSADPTSFQSVASAARGRRQAHAVLPYRLLPQATTFTRRQALLPRHRR